MADITILHFVPNGEIYDYLALPHTMLLNQNIIDEYNVSLGDDVFIVGLFVRHAGKEKNIPIIRAGNIAAIPEEPIHNKFFGDMDAYLIELRSLGGLSGSPVLLHLSGNRIMQNGNSVTRVGDRGFYLLGLLHGHWDLSSAIQDVITEDYQQEDKEKINTGIGISIPSTKILEALNQMTLSEQREKIIQDIKIKTPQPKI